MNSVSQHRFSMIPRAEIPRSVFDRSHNRKMTLESDYLVPVFVDEVLPGDSFKLDFDLFCRMTSPLTTPVMDNLYLDTFWFFVPSRLVWDNWQKFCGEKENPDDSIDYVMPTLGFDVTQADGQILPLSKTNTKVGALANCFGLPIFANADNKNDGAPLQSGKLAVNSLPFRAYNLIYNEWFRDQNLMDSVPVYKGDADWPALPDSAADDYSLRKRAKRHDYFTSSLPAPQRGPGVELPLGGLAPVALYSTVGMDADVSNIGDKRLDYITAFSNGGAIHGYEEDAENSKNLSVSYAAGTAWSNTNSAVIAADLTSATAATINSLRQAFQLQRFYERENLGGSRYTEIIRSFFGVISPDARLQRPEYLGGSSQPFIVNPISQTSATNEVTPQGNLTAIGLTGSSKRGFRKSFVEHGYIIGLVNVRADVNYQQGVRRMWSRKTRFDFYWPTLAHLGEQAVLNKEIFVQGDGVLQDGEAADNRVFGYQERWAEYRYFPNEIVGLMSSVAKTNFDIWHLAQYFTNQPGLNKEFIESNTPLSRVSAVPEEPDFLLDINIKCQAARPMPVYSVPGLIDHF